MSAPKTNRVALCAIIALALIALIMVATGFFQPPQPDEGAAAHLFQLSIAAFAATITLFFATADWKRPLLLARQLAFPLCTVALAFGALFYLERLR